MYFLRSCSLFNLLTLFNIQAYAVTDCEASLKVSARTQTHTLFIIKHLHFQIQIVLGFSNDKSGTKLIRFLPNLLCLFLFPLYNISIRSMFIIPNTFFLF
jgi:hypothetical protein